MYTFLKCQTCTEQGGELSLVQLSSCEACHSSPVILLLGVPR